MSSGISKFFQVSEADLLLVNSRISEQLAIKALSKASGIESKKIIELWKKKGDLGLVAEEIMKTKKQNTLFSHKLTSEKILDNLRKLPELQGKGTVEKKISLISELLTSAKTIEAKYITRTLLGDLRIGIGEGVLRDAIVWACFNKGEIAHYCSNYKHRAMCVLVLTVNFVN